MTGGATHTVLRVGTTGDYPPVSAYDAESGTFSGEDIALIEAFARDQLCRLDWVLTRGVAARRAATVPALDAEGAVLSDHDVLVVDLESG